MAQEEYIRGRLVPMDFGPVDEEAQALERRELREMIGRFDEIRLFAMWAVLIALCDDSPEARHRMAQYTTAHGRGVAFAFMQENLVKAADRYGPLRLWMFWLAAMALSGNQEIWTDLPEEVLPD